MQINKGFFLGLPTYIGYGSIDIGYPFSVRGPSRKDVRGEGGGSAKMGQTRTGGRESSQSGRPPSMIRIKDCFNMSICGLEFIPTSHALCDPFHHGIKLIPKRNSEQKG